MHGWIVSFSPLVHFLDPIRVLERFQLFQNSYSAVLDRHVEAENSRLVFIC